MKIYMDILVENIYYLVDDNQTFAVTVYPTRIDYCPAAMTQNYLNNNCLLTSINVIRKINSDLASCIDKLQVEYFS